jgi:EAL domain-containing protein (putative c-di-GMP-specific phosphodiesterase class I)
VKIGRWVLQEACSEAVRWKDRYRGHRLTVAINLSPRQLFETDIVEVVRDSLEASGLPAEDVVLELTEGIMVNATPAILDRLHALKDLGVRLAVDDFGTGYSSLAYLQQLPFDILKIDKLFIDSITDGPAESAFALAVVRLAQSVNLEMVAEGVENGYQARILGALGCQMAQGYHYAPPLAVDELDAFIAAGTVPART